MKTLKLPNTNKCTGCMACIDVCSHNALSPYISSDGFWQVKYDPTKCVDCHLCERTCPINQRTKYGVNKLGLSTPYAAWSINDGIRLSSSSGGVFAELAISILNKGGVVFGATIVGCEVRHIVVDNLSDLHLLQGSKYLQSNMTGVYKQVRSILKEKSRQVLFSGTPCQVAGLFNFLRQPYDNLYTIDLVCHGVPSYNLLDLVERKNKIKISSLISFRDKQVSWLNSYALSVIDSNGKVIRYAFSEQNDVFTTAFSNGLNLRESCYKCKFSGIHRKSDISLADYWGYVGNTEKQCLGVSAVIVHSVRGDNLLKDCRIKLNSTSLKKCCRSNPRMYTGYNLMKYHPIRLIRKYILSPKSIKYDDFILNDMKKLRIYYPIRLASYFYMKLLGFIRIYNYKAIFK